MKNLSAEENEIIRRCVDNDRDSQQKIYEKYAINGNANTEDGLKINFKDSWVHLRKSNTEPIIRIIAEAPTAGQAEKLVEQFKENILAL